jgi:hypothetical protein
MMNAIFLVRGRFELFGAVNAGFAIGPGSIKQLFACGGSCVSGDFGEDDLLEGRFRSFPRQLQCFLIEG